MIKGVSKRVVVVKSPDTKLFEEAIFLVRDDAAAQGVTRDELLREAGRIAGISAGNIKVSRMDKLRHSFPAVMTGAAITGAVWLLTIML